jgi:hypothetical protein
LPAGLNQTLSSVIDQAITSATTVGVLGMVFALALIIHGGRWVEFGPHCGDLRLRF